MKYTSRIHPRPFPFLGCVLSLVLWPTFTGCSTPERKPAVPAQLTAEAQIAGLPGIRYILGEDAPQMLSDARASLLLEQEHLAASGHNGPAPPAHYLALSGGGDNGAFGAGLLAGWTEAGNRPEFQVVTGVSIGAMIGPFAFLGPSQDETLREIFTTIGPDDVYDSRGVFSVLYNDAVAGSDPLRELLAKYVDEELLALVAAEHHKGRWLLVATTNLDAGRPVVWNMGMIAASGHPGALQLFRDVMLASASVSGAFPPVMIDVEAGGGAYHEMHVDGGSCTQVFLFPPGVMELATEQGMTTTRERHAYIVRNGRLVQDWAHIERSTLEIFARSVALLIQNQGIGDLFRIHSTLQEAQTEFNLAFIRKDFEAEHPEEFDTGYMQALYAYGREKGRHGYPWVKSPQELVTRLGVGVALGGDAPDPPVAMP